MASGPDRPLASHYNSAIQNIHTANTPLPSLADAGLKATPPRVLFKTFPTSSFQAPVLTGAAALADEQRMREPTPVQPRLEYSANPAHTFNNSLMRSPHQDTSKPSDAPVAAMTNDASNSSMTPSMPIVAEPMEIDEPETSSGAFNGSVIHDGTVDKSSNPGDSLRPPTTASDTRQGERSNKALTYPPRMIDDSPSNPARGMSLPGSNSAKSPSSNKKHKCPNCSTEFTRHHNLKSHLLTHSQEKPFACDHCNQKFRRLHDLKRHAKLHTGERPHVCEKCKRKFARGDALARHSKGPGGCAGRRGSGGEEDDFIEGDTSFNGDESMNGDQLEDQDIAEQGDFKRTKSESNHNRKRSFQQAVDPNLQPPRIPSSYPPVAPMTRMDAGQENNQFATPQHLSPHMAGSQPPGPPSHFPAAASYFAAQGGVTESPKPLSPGSSDSRRPSVQSGFAPPPRGRSPSLNTAFQQQHIRSNTHNTPHGTPPILPAPISQAPPQLPSLPGFASDARRQPFPSPTGSSFSSRAPGAPPPIISTHRPPPPINGPPSANSSGASSHPRSSGGSMREILNTGPSEDWFRDYVRKSEAEKQGLRDEMSAQKAEYETALADLRRELEVLKGGHQPLMIPAPGQGL